MYKTDVRGKLIDGEKTLSQISNEILAPIDAKTPLWWYIALAISLSMLAMGLVCIYITLTVGIGTWGLNSSVAWGWEIINFVWWIGIGHAGTAFSIFLLILRQKWRTAINRAAEAMTVVAVICAALFPLIHMGRAWLFFFIFPYPNTRGPLWVNFNSPLFWDFTAITAYLLISASFWYFGMVPDFATIRDSERSKIKKAIYGFLAFGWTGSSREWLRYEGLAFVLGGIAAVLVVSVHSIVSTDFAVSVEPGWHTTLFPPYFVVGAIFSGFAMVLTLVTLMKKLYKMGDFITENHVDAVCRILIFISLIMGTAYITEIFIAWYSGSEYEFYTFFKNRIAGDYAFEFWTMFTCNALIPQLFWSRRVRRNSWIVFIISLIINVGMWFERFNIVVTSLAKSYLPSNWVTYHPTIIEIGFFIGTLGLFGAGVLLFFRFLPQIAISEVKMVSKFNTQQSDHLKPGHHDYE
ncbi:MAG TPA: NrfD/PsrC family molybdoenzyme membrane anchor subunit [Prolixibacteraceae bacterium]|nr:NrfD/PsrC family molybdoenzyme membrane anchor subunit [Prolixibacteraceae bacterium]